MRDRCAILTDQQRTNFTAKKTKLVCTVPVPNNVMDKTSDTSIATCMHGYYQSFTHAQVLHSN